MTPRTKRPTRRTSAVEDAPKTRSAEQAHNVVVADQDDHEPTTPDTVPQPPVDQSRRREPVRQIPTHDETANLLARDNIVSDGPGTVRPPA